MLHVICEKRKRKKNFKNDEKKTIDIFSTNENRQNLKTNIKFFENRQN